MAEYSYKDVIIDPNDPRVEIGKEYYFGDTPREALNKANGNETSLILDSIYNVESNYRPFYFGRDALDFCSCIIRKKEPEKKYVPFDLNDMEQIFELCGCWLVDKDHGDYYCATAIYPYDNLIHVDDYGEISPEHLLEKFEFMYNGAPCGKLVEEE